ncbi:helix-turn-helix domain-containing protein [Nonomuraea sp. NPDC000554]|uniref:helix-turn-helix domain-containing protein n=1 Tax=Nonomuraea sp. NPDC000554 TaxID=3154259 RepID=UPI003333FE68
MRVAQLVKRAFKYRFYPTSEQAEELPRLRPPGLQQGAGFKSRKKSRLSAECIRSAFTYRSGRLTLAKSARTPSNRPRTRWASPRWREGRQLLPRADRPAQARQSPASFGPLGERLG